MTTGTSIAGSQSRQVPRPQTWNCDGRLDKEGRWGDARYDGNALDTVGGGAYFDGGPVWLVRTDWTAG